MWRMDIFIRHNCGELENTVGRRWARVRLIKTWMIKFWRHLLQFSLILWSLAQGFFLTFLTCRTSKFFRYVKGMSDPWSMQGFNGLTVVLVKKLRPRTRVKNLENYVKLRKKQIWSKNFSNFPKTAINYLKPFRSRISTFVGRLQFYFSKLSFVNSILNHKRRCYKTLSLLVACL